MNFKGIWLFLGISLAVPVTGLAGEQFLIVSDVDDTLKVTHVDSAWDSFIRALFSNRAFSGMPEVMQALLMRDPGNQVVYLSAAPEFLRFRVSSFLKTQKFPAGDLILRKSSDPSNRAEYKLQRLEEIAKTTRRRLILIGDDTEADPEAYHRFFTYYPDRVAEIYIRSIESEAMPPAIYSFLTSYDLARYEYGFGRLGFVALKGIADKILQDPKTKRVLPPFQKCPELAVKRYLGPDVEALDLAIAGRVRNICAERAAERD